MAATWKKLAYKADVLPDLLSPYAVGDLLYASSTSALSKLADVAVGQVLVSGGVDAAPAWSAMPTLTTSLTVPTIIGPAASLVLKPTTDGVTAIQLSDKDGNAILNVDTTNDRVGIGTTAPSERLTVGDGITSAQGIHINAGDNAAIRFQTAGTYNWGILNEFPSSGKLTFYDYYSGASMVTFQSGGAVGIGTTTPTLSGTGKLHMAADTMRLDTARTPASAGAAGNKGEICWDADYVYIAVDTNSWKRAAIAAW